jgi:pyruvate kinase
MLQHARSAAAARGRPFPVLMDLAGPKLRVTEVLCADPPRLGVGDRFALLDGSAAPIDGTPSARCSHPEIFAALRPGSSLWVDDGKLGAVAEQVGPGSAVFRVITAGGKGVKLKPERGLNLPGAALAVPALTAKDLADLDFVAAHADLVGYSFVQRPSDIAWLQSEVAARCGAPPLPPLVVKIETRTAVENLPRLLVAAAGRQPLAVMLARGDLAVEVGFDRLSEIQEEILWLCEAAHVPIIWATQVLEHLVRNGSPSRAETTDAAMGQRAECIMLNKGPHLIEGVRFLDNVLRRMDRHQAKKTPRLAPLKSWQALQSIELEGVETQGFV